MEEKKNKTLNNIIYILFIFFFLFGIGYTLTIIYKMQLMSENKKLNKKIDELNFEINKINLELDKKIDLKQIEIKAKKMLDMEISDEIIYVKINKEK
ncbi:cell division protein FtsL [Hypnocyclicus thermotrophus]|uniref:Cell division protein FtsL n=1 Tax=Hypnocyclicus thermotrophus TaxID=1627895 RepID=A0AA46I5T8_9FUSO|nr:cell division protein FtsL [Hypnocyclicus thermotrophus]TDT71563.1 cell division protein FtsL [Hypnocyclicus thermotrophus]